MEKKRFPVADAHNDFLLLLRKGDTLDAPMGQAQHMTLEGMRAGGMKLAFFAAFPGGRQERDRAMVKTLLLIHDYHRMVAQHGLKHLAPGMGPDCISDGEIGTLLTIEGADALGGQLEMVHIFHQLGVRLITLTWNHRNELADGVGETEGAGGLTTFGRDVVREMNALKMMVDVSHLNEQGFWDAMEVSDLPILASHSNAKKICPHRRNLTDEQIIALHKAGGFIGINFYSRFLAAEGEARIQDIVRHIDHMASLGALDIVGLGSDFDGIDEAPAGLHGPQDVPRILDALADCGYTDEQILGIAYNNMARYLQKFS